MLLAATFLILDMFGLQVARVGDVNNDGISEVAITNPWGEKDSPHAGRVWIVDVSKWAVVEKLVGAEGETAFGGTMSVARTAERAFLAVASRDKDGEHGRVRLLESPKFESRWSESIELAPILKTWTPQVACVVETGSPSVFYFQPSTANADEDQHLVLWRRTNTRAEIVSDLAGRVPLATGQNLCPHFDAEGKLDGLFVSVIDKYLPPFTRSMFTGHATVHWVALPDGKSSVIVPTDEPKNATGIVLLSSDANRGAFACDALAVRRKLGGEIVRLSKTGSVGTLSVSDNWSTRYWGAALCWLSDLDGDAIDELVIGCPVGLGGSVLVVGSKTKTLIRTIEPKPMAGLDPDLHIHYSSSFGTQVCPIADQDGDGREDLLVAATTMGASGAYPAALSVVSTKSWKIIRVVFEKDLAGANTAR